MTVEVSQVEAPEEPSEPSAEHELLDEEGDPPDPDLPSNGVVPCSVWFGPVGPRSFEREMLGYLGSHNGVAVLQWPRDLERAARCSLLGIPALCLMSDPKEPICRPQELQEWLPSNATDRDIHDSLRRLSQHGASRRAAALLKLESDGLRLGNGEVHLDPEARDLAAVLIASFEHAVDDTALEYVPTSTSKARHSLVSELLQLDREVNQLGLEVVPVKDHAHLMRRCGR